MDVETEEVVNRSPRLRRPVKKAIQDLSSDSEDESRGSKRAKAKARQKRRSANRPLRQSLADQPVSEIANAAQVFDSLADAVFDDNSSDPLLDAADNRIDAGSGQETFEPIDPFAYLDDEEAEASANGQRDSATARDVTSSPPSPPTSTGKQSKPNSTDRSNRRRRPTKAKAVAAEDEPVAEISRTTRNSAKRRRVISDSQDEASILSSSESVSSRGKRPIRAKKPKLPQPAITIEKADVEDAEELVRPIRKRRRLLSTQAASEDGSIRDSAKEVQSNHLRVGNGEVSRASSRQGTPSKRRRSNSSQSEAMSHIREGGSDTKTQEKREEMTAERKRLEALKDTALHQLERERELINNGTHPLLDMLYEMLTAERDLRKISSEKWRDAMIADIECLGEREEAVRWTQWQEDKRELRAKNLSDLDIGMRRAYHEYWEASRPSVAVQRPPEPLPFAAELFLKSKGAGSISPYEAPNYSEAISADRETMWSLTADEIENDFRVMGFEMPSSKPPPSAIPSASSSVLYVAPYQIRPGQPGMPLTPQTAQLSARAAGTPLSALSTLKRTTYIPSNTQRQSYMTAGYGAPSQHQQQPQIQLMTAKDPSIPNARIGPPLKPSVLEQAVPVFREKGNFTTPSVLQPAPKPRPQSNQPIVQNDRIVFPANGGAGLKQSPSATAGRLPMVYDGFRPSVKPVIEHKGAPANKNRMSEWMKNAAGARMDPNSNASSLLNPKVGFAPIPGKSGSAAVWGRPPGESSHQESAHFPTKAIPYYSPKGAPQRVDNVRPPPSQSRPPTTRVDAPYSREVQQQQQQQQQHQSNAQYFPHFRSDLLPKGAIADRPTIPAVDLTVNGQKVDNSKLEQKISPPIPSRTSAQPQAAAQPQHSSDLTETVLAQKSVATAQLSAAPAEKRAEKREPSPYRVAQPSSQL